MNIAVVRDITLPTLVSIYRRSLETCGLHLDSSGYFKTLLASETLINFCQSLWRHSREDGNLYCMYVLPNWWHLSERLLRDCDRLIMLLVPVRKIVVNPAVYLYSKRNILVFLFLLMFLYVHGPIHSAFRTLVSVLWFCLKVSNYSRPPIQRHPHFAPMKVTEQKIPVIFTQGNLR